MGVDKSRAIDRAISADFDGDGAKEAVTWTRARSEPPETQSSGELVVFGVRSPAGRVIATTPPFVPAGPGCHHTVALSQTGPHTVTLDVLARCDAPLLARSPTRGLAVIAPVADRTSIVALRIADPAQGESFDVAVDSSDRDGDGRDDVRATVTLHSTLDPEDVSADLVWLDRAAGPSRDAAEPSRSLGKAGKAEAGRTPGTSAAREVFARVANARRLYATLCAESGTPRIFDADGGPLECPEAGSGLKELVRAEVRAALARHDAVAAAAALARDGWYGAPLPSRDRGALEADLSRAAPPRAAVEERVEPIPRAKSGLPRFSPLAFEPDRALLVQTVNGVVRLRADGHAEDASESVDPWPLTVGSGTDPRWTGIAFPCERSELMLMLADASGTPLTPEPVRVLAPRPGPCGHTPTLPEPSLVPLEWSAARHAGLVGGSLFGADTLSDIAPTPVRGAPRSPDGKTLVTPTPRGLLVSSGSTAELWSLTTPSELSDCVVANGAAAAACVRGDHAALFTPEAKTKKKR